MAGLCKVKDDWLTMESPPKENKEVVSQDVNELDETKIESNFFSFIGTWRRWLCCMIESLKLVDG